MSGLENYSVVYTHLVEGLLFIYPKKEIQGVSNMTGTDLCVNKPHKSRSYLNHLVDRESYPKTNCRLPYIHNWAMA